MKTFDLSTAINKLKFDKTIQCNQDIKYQAIPEWVQGKDFFYLFLPYLELKIDSRERDEWIKNACEYYGINWSLSVKDKKTGNENLKEGDITFKVKFGNQEFDYTNIFAVERKGCASEYFGNITKERNRIESEFFRQLDKGYKKFILMLEFGNCLQDLIDYEYAYYDEIGKYITKSCGFTIFSTIMSWKQRYRFEVLQVEAQQSTKKEKWKAREKLFFLMLLEMFYFFRNEIREDCITKKLLE